MSRKIYPGPRNALLSSYAWCAELARGTLCRRKETVSKHVGRDTQAMQETARENKHYSTREMVSKDVTLWVV